ncbi:hypothetical protein XHV734_3432 [Xanthomonas hortorum pv. vitians]|nr:hypothetical protein XHV734_3432 [Xanthomonas hortorum pv. vitians]
MLESGETDDSGTARARFVAACDVHSPFYNAPCTLRAPQRSVRQSLRHPAWLCYCAWLPCSRRHIGM